MKPVKNLLIACTGSVATIKLTALVQNLQSSDLMYKFNIRIIFSENAKHFIGQNYLVEGIELFDDKDEWLCWNKRGDPVLHIELGKWADLLLIAPLSANSLAKIATGICDNLLTSVVRAWDINKPLFFCPAMNTRMYDHPITKQQLKQLKSWGYIEVACIEKTLMCGDTGNGAMAEVPTIVENIINYFIKHT